MMKYKFTVAGIILCLLVAGLVLFCNAPFFASLGKEMGKLYEYNKHIRSDERWAKRFWVFVAILIMVMSAWSWW